jgi:hypothetical protein
VEEAKPWITKLKVFTFLCFCSLSFIPAKQEITWTHFIPPWLSPSNPRPSSSRLLHRLNLLSFSLCPLPAYRQTGALPQRSYYSVLQLLFFFYLFFDLTGNYCCLVLLLR